MKGAGGVAAQMRMKGRLGPARTAATGNESTRDRIYTFLPLLLTAALIILLVIFLIVVVGRTFAPSPPPSTTQSSSESGTSFVAGPSPLTPTPSPSQVQSPPQQPTGMR